MDMEKKKGIYVTTTPMERLVEDTSDGISRKQFYHIQTFKNAGFDMDVINPKPEKEKWIYKIERRLPIPIPSPKSNVIDYVASHDFMYIRNERVMRGYFYLLVKRAKQKNPRMKVVLEIPTYPYENELRHMPFKDKILYFNGVLWRKDFLKYIDRIATYSRDDIIWGIRTIKFSNAIIFNKCKRTSLLTRLNGNTIEIIACAQLTFWHGYDRALKGLADYYNKNADRKYNILLHVVGDGPIKENCLEKYKAIVKEAGIEDKVIFHGRQSGANLDAIYDKCIIGLDSMGRHRSQVYYNSSLKGKEYLAKGLIIVSGVDTELDYDNQYPYYIRVPADESNVDFYKIMDKLDCFLNENHISDIQRKIMLYARDNFDYSVAMKDVIEFFDNNSL